MSWLKNTYYDYNILEFEEIRKYQVICMIVQCDYDNGD